ncbi:MAG TPA: phosphatidylglycerophosphatase A [Gammaproteobacteria bacterium]|nr:phosphatidylglycerophosphatase A [Gammaproteobacteria bacterium]
MSRNQAPPSIWRNPVHFLAFGCGAGAAPWAPGTFGTLAAVPLYLLVRDLPLGIYLLLTGTLFAVGVWLCGSTARDIRVHDHPGIVWDEVVGFFLTMTAAPPGWHWLVGGFLLFRLFDVWKPWPVRLLDRRVGGGLGIMLDDAVAALYAALLLWVVRNLV